MNRSQKSPQIVYVSTYVPKKCGLATYTQHLRDAVNAAKGARIPDPVVAVCSPEERADYRDPWVWPLLKSDPDECRRIADEINRSQANLVSLQHEFGIFGGDAGAHVIELMKRIDRPIVTTFHTVFETPPEPYASIQRQIASLSGHLIVMNRKGIGYLQDSFGISPDRISFIPHGTPVPGPVKRNAVRRRMGWENRKVLFTFGLLGRGKGVELALRALAGAVQAVPELLYIIAGQTHPEVRKHEGEAYREELQAMVSELGLDHHVRMMDRFIPEDELSALISAADLYITPYPGMQQITSGTLAYAAGLGRPILSTPYAYAQDLVQGHEEMLLPYGDAEAWSAKMIELFSYPALLAEWGRIVAEIGRTMHWPHVGAQHLRLFEQLAFGRARPERRGKPAGVG